MEPGQRGKLYVFFKTKTKYLGLGLKLDSSVLNIKPEHLLLQVDRIREKDYYLPSQV